MSLPAKEHKSLKGLIETLEKSEKKYIKLYSKMQKGEKRYIFIFDFYNNRIKNNDENLKKALQKENILTEKVKDPDAFIRSHKKYTYDYIMAVLRLMYEKHGMEEQKAKEYFANAKIYLEKFGPKPASEELKKAHDLFKKYENYTSLIEVSKMELHLEQILEKKTSLENCQVINQQIANYSDLLMLENIFNELRVKFFIHYRNHARGKYNQVKLVELKELLKHQSFNQENAARSFKTHSAYYVTLGYYSLISNEIVDAQSHFEKILDLWKENQHFITEQSNIYTSLLSNYLNICTINENLGDKFLGYLKLLAFQKPQTIKNKLNQLQEILFLKLRYYMSSGQLKEAQLVINEIILKLNSFIDIIPASRRIAFFFNISVFYFIMENFETASEWIKKWERLEEKSMQRIDLQIRWKYLELIMETEFNPNLDIFVRVGSISNHIRHKGMLGKLELLIMRFLIKIKETPFKRERIYQMRLFYAELENYKANLHEENIGGLGITEIQTWLESRMNNKKMYNVYSHNRQGKFQKNTKNQVSLH